MVQQRFNRLQERIASMSQREKQLRKLRGLLEEAAEAVIHHHGPIGRLSEYGEVLAKGSDGEVLMTCPDGYTYRFRRGEEPSAEALDALDQALSIVLALLAAEP